MSKSRVASIRLDDETLTALRKHCRAHGLKHGPFVSNAIMAALRDIGATAQSDAVLDMLTEINERVKRLPGAR